MPIRTQHFSELIQFDMAEAASTTEEHRWSLLRESRMRARCGTIDRVYRMNALIFRVVDSRSEMCKNHFASELNSYIRAAPEEKCQLERGGDGTRGAFLNSQLSILIPFIWPSKIQTPFALIAFFSRMPWKLKCWVNRDAFQSDFRFYHYMPRSKCSKYKVVLWVNSKSAESWEIAENETETETETERHRTSERASQRTKEKEK